MEQQMDRLDMLKHLSFIGGDDAISIFSAYIPDHYNEIYTLYELLKSIDINYNSIQFLKPQESKDSFVFLCNFDNFSDLEMLKGFLKNNDSKVKYMRNKPFTIIIKDQANYTCIKFKQT